MKTARICLLLSVLAYSLLIIPFTAYLKSRPLQLKVGYVPEAKVLKVMTADQRFMVADWVVMKAIFYFGSLVEKEKRDKLYVANPDYPGMFRILQTGLRLDPYNADAYYFTQAAYTWEVGKYREVNNMLEYGMKYRTWDAQLPFFAAFNAAYFMKDYKKAAEYMKKAAEISGDQQFATLAARFFYEAGETEFGILFINVMEGGAKDANEKRLYTFRRKALVAIQALENALKRYERLKGARPALIEELVQSGFITSIPNDPYGGKFYLDEAGRVRSTSKLSFAQIKNAN